MVVSLVACAPATSYYVPSNTDAAQHVLTKRFAFFPKRGVAVMALVAPQDGALPSQPWHRWVFAPDPPLTRKISDSSSPPSSAEPIEEMLPCIYGVTGKFAIYASRLLAELAASREGKGPHEVYVVCE